MNDGQVTVCTKDRNIVGGLNVTPGGCKSLGAHCLQSRYYYCYLLLPNLLLWSVRTFVYVLKKIYLHNRTRLELLTVSCIYKVEYFKVIKKIFEKNQCSLPFSMHNLRWFRAALTKAGQVGLH